jgi:hypothetical protein
MSSDARLKNLELEPLKGSKVFPISPLIGTGFYLKKYRVKAHASQQKRWRWSGELPQSNVIRGSQPQHHESDLNLTHNHQFPILLSTRKRVLII